MDSYHFPSKEIETIEITSIMQSSTSLSSISSTSSNNSSIYGSQTILTMKDLPSAAPRCRSSLISSFKCRSLLRSSPIYSKEYFNKLSQHYPLLLVLNDYQCSCGCHFSIEQGTFVILYSRKYHHGYLTVISNQMICSKIPSSFLCNVDVLRARVRSRISCDEEQSFDL